MFRTRLTSAIVIGVLSAAAVGGTVFAQEADEEAATHDAMADSTAYELAVTLQEWAVLPESLSIPAGSVTINATNIGPMDPHELVVVRTDIPAAELPTREDGSFDEDAEGVEVIGEIEEFEVGATQSMTLDLEPGSYVFLCNLVEDEDDGLEAHYQLGMWIGVEVTDGSQAAGQELAVTLQEWAVLPESLSIPAGSVTINATNIGPMDPHELVVVRTDIPAGELPTREDGSFDEDAEGVEVIGEIEEFEVGATQSMTLDLEPGSYVFLCNLVEEEDDGVEAHYQLGMWIGVEVTA